jgi:hypothetical protein
VTSLPDFLLSIAKAAVPPERHPGSMCIIIRRPYTHLENELRRTFKGQEDVKIVVDKRHGERRVSQQPISEDRRLADRRKKKEPLVEAVIFV